MCFGGTQQGPTTQNYGNQASTSIAATTYDPATIARGNSIMDKMQGAVSSNPAELYNGPAKADFGSQWGIAGDWLKNALGQGSPANLSDAGKMISQVLAGMNPNASTADFMSPYVQATLDPVIRNIQQQANLQGAGNARDATMAGQYGGSAQGVRQALLDRNTQQNIGDAAASVYDRAFNSANQTRLATLGQFLGGAGQLGNIGQAQGSYGAQLAGALGGMGANEQKAGQTGINTELAINKQNALLPVQQLSPLAAALASIPKNSTTVTNSTGATANTGTSSQPDNTGFGLLGALLAGI